MSFVTKHMSKKMLSVILALMILITTVSVAFSAIANAAAAPYVVTEGKPAIAMLSGQTIDLNKINVEFGIEEVPGEEITWAATPNSAIVFDATAETLTVLKPGAYTLTATKTSDTSKTRTVNVFATAEATTEVPLYEHTFTADDLTAEGEFTTESGWKTVRTEGTGKNEYVDGAIINNNTATSVYYVLDPASEKGIMLGAFADVSYEATINTKYARGKSGWYGLAARLTYANNVVSDTPASTIEAWYKMAAASATSLLRLNATGDITADTGLDILPGDKKIPTNAFVKFKIELNGDKMNAYYDLADGNGFVKTADEGDLSASQKTAFEATAAKGGTIAVYSDKSARIGMSYVKVTVPFTQTELDKIQNACTNSNLYFVSKSKPAIQMLSGKTLDLNRMIVEFNDNSIALGSQVTWTMAENNAAILDTSNGNRITVFKPGTYELTATSTANTQNKKTIYVFAVDSKANELTVFDYTFSAADAGLAAKDSAGNAIWSYSGAGNWGWVTTISGAYTVSAPRLRNDSGAGVIYLNPESEGGKLVSAFADYTFYLTAVTHENWTNPASFTKYFPMLTRYTMAGETYDLVADTYLGYRAYFTTNGGAVLVGNTAVASSTLTYPYVNSNPHVDFKLQVEGEEVIFSAKPTNVMEYTQVFKMSDAAAVPAAVTATVGKTGTIGVYTDANNRPSLQKAKVTLSFTDKDLEAVEKCYIGNNYYVVSAAKPAIPMKVNTKINLNNVVVEIADGEFMLGTDIAWESTSGALVYDETSNTVSAYRKDDIILKAKKSASDAAAKEIYVLVRDEISTQVEIFNYQFSQTDAGTAADADSYYYFGGSGEEKTWIFYRKGGTMGWTKSDGSWDPSHTGISANAQDGIWMLNPKSEDGKMVSSFADYIIDFTACTHYNWRDLHKGFPFMARYVMKGTEPSLANDSYLGYYAVWSSTAKGGVFVNNASHSGTTALFNGYDSGVMNTDFRLRLKGQELQFWAKMTNKSDYQLLYTMSEDASAPAAAKATAGQAGTLAINNHNSTRPRFTQIKVAVEFDEAEIQKLVATDVAALYNLTQSYPAVPVNKGNKVMLKDILVELPNGEFLTGDKLDWSCAYVGSAFFVDNSEKAVYAYGEGRYDVTIKNGNEDVMTAYFLVSADGIYRLFNHTFTKADYDAMAATGKSDMWIASFHSHTNESSTSPNGTAGWATQWSNTIPSLTSTNSQFDENKGISLYSNTAMLLTLNPEYPDAKIIAKFNDYNIDFTSSARDKQLGSAAAWTQTGRVGALGRVNFGTDGDFDFLYSRYLIAYYPGTLQYGRLSLNIGSVANYSLLDAEADSYTWSCSKEGITLDDEAGTITANAPGVYHVVGTKSDNTTKTVSIIVGSEAMDHHILGAINVTATPGVTVGTPEGIKANNYLADTSFNLTRTGNVSLNVPDTYNYRVALKGNNIAMYIAPNGTSNYAELYNSAIDPKLDSTLKNSIATGNRSTGTIALFSEGGARAFFKSVSVSLDFDAIPSQTSLGECYEEGSSLIYLEVGQVFDLTKANFEAGGKYHNGANITFSNVPAGLNVVNGVSITPTAIGDYTLKGKGTDGTNITISVAVSAAGAIYDNGNYQFTAADGIITAYSRKDTSKPYSAFVRFPSEYDGKHIYELGSALALGNANNKQLVAIEIEKYIEKIGAGAFIDATKLEKVTIPNTVESIGSSAFAGTTALKEIFLPASVSDIGESAFRYNTALVVTIANKDAVIGENAFSAGATIKGYAGGKVEAWANANGINFVALTGADKDAADASVADFEQIVYDRYNKVNTSVEWILATSVISGRTQYRIEGFKFTDRSAGKFFIPKELKVTVDGKEQTVSVYPYSGTLGDSVDSRAVYALELEEGITNIGFWAFRGCYNLRDVKLPKTLTNIAQQTFKDCTSLEKIDIPKAVVTIGLYAFENCINLKEVNVHPDSMLQTVGTNAVRKTEIPGRILYGTQVEKFVFPVSVDWITNTTVTSSNAPKLKEVWIYNKDCSFTIDTTAWQYYFNKGTIIHGVPGSTAEELVKADQALGASHPNYRGLVFVGDLEDFYEVNDGVKHEDGFFSGEFMQYDPDPTKEGAWVEKENPYYAITKYTGKGGSVVMPAYLDIRGQKNVPIYAVSAEGFQFETVPTGGLPKIINLEISEGIAVIEDEAFSGAIHMKSLKLPSTLIKIGAKAFVGTSIEGKLELPKNVAEIGNAAFRNNDKLTDIVIPNPNAIIGSRVFDASITIHGVKGSTAEAYATENKIKFVEIPAPSQSTVSDFSDNGNYKFTVTDGYITGYERVDATKPYSQKITVPATIDGVAIKGVAAGAFDKGAEATSIMAIELQEGVTEIPKDAFKGLLKLARVSLPKTLKTIGESAFEGTALNGEITLPESLEKIEKNAFKNLNNISAITVLSKTVVIDPAALPRLNKNMKVYGYTDSTTEAWAKSVKWQNFEYLDGAPSDEPGEDPEKPGEGNKDNEPVEDPIEGGNSANKVIRVIRQSNLALVIVIAVSMLLLAVILAAVVVVIVVVKKKRDEEMEL